MSTLDFWDQQEPFPRCHDADWPLQGSLTFARVDRIMPPLFSGQAIAMPRDQSESDGDSSLTPS